MQAYIYGIRKYSETDWEGRRCMVIFFSGCGYKCPYCYVPRMLGFSAESLVNVREVKKLISNSTDIDAVLFTGGEPCLQKLALLNLAKFCKDLGLQVGIETNGSRHDTLLLLLEGRLVDFARLDVKAPMDDEEFERVTKSSTFFKPSSQNLEDFRASLALLKKYEGKIQLELRTSIVPTLLFRKESILNIAKMLDGFSSPWYLQKFTPSGEMAGKSLLGIKSPSGEFLENLLELVQKEFPGIDSRIRDDMGIFTIRPETVSELGIMPENTAAEERGMP